MKYKLIYIFTLFYLIFSGCSAPEFLSYLTNNDYRFNNIDTNKICGNGINYLEYYCKTEDFTKLKDEWKLAIYKSLMDCYYYNFNYSKVIEYALKMIELYGAGYYTYLSFYSDNYSYASFKIPTYEDIAYLYYLNKDYDKSEKYYLKEVERKDWQYSTSSIIGLSELYYNIGEKKAAINILDKAIYKIDQKEDLAKLYFQRGSLYIKYNEKEKACNDFRKSMEYGNYEADKYILETCF